MRLPCLSKGLISLGLLPALLSGASSCGSDYGLFAINVVFASSVTPQDRQFVDKCKLTISDDSGKTLLKDYLIDPIATPDGTVTSGCAGGGRTPQIVGRPAVSYSTSRSSGRLTFTVNAVDDNEKVLHTGSKQADIKVFHSKADEQTVDIELSAAP
jgi:hypothetical protein